MKKIWWLLGALIVSSSLCAQQVADPDFDSRVDAPVFVRVHPGVLFDEGHHNVHKSDLTYKAFVSLLRNDGCRVDVNSGPFTADVLRGYRLLVIAGALGAPLGDDRAREPAFTDAEIDVVKRWVNRGGSLLLLTDHEPVASSVESLVRAFGVTSMKDVVADQEHRFEAYAPTNVLASIDNGLLTDHPVTRGIGRVLVFGGQSFLFPRTATVLIRVGKRAEARNDGTLGEGQAGALRFGRGRVIITGDMGMLSAQLVTQDGVTGKWGMNVPGIDNRQLVLNISRWLLDRAR